MARNYANKLISASTVVQNLGTIVPIPTTESQARPLTSLPPDQQREVWQEAVETAPKGMVAALLYIEAKLRKRLFQRVLMTKVG